MPLTQDLFQLLLFFPFFFLPFSSEWSLLLVSISPTSYKMVVLPQWPKNASTWKHRLSPSRRLWWHFLSLPVMLSFWAAHGPGGPGSIVKQHAPLPTAEIVPVISLNGPSFLRHFYLWTFPKQSIFFFCLENISKSIKSVQIWSPWVINSYFHVPTEHHFHKFVMS